MFQNRIKWLLVFGTVAAVTRIYAGVFSSDIDESKSNHDAEVHANMFRTFSAQATTVPYLSVNTKIAESQLRDPTSVAARSLRVRGNVGESMMDDFYLSEGWDKVNGQTGNQGIDGLYVRRGQSGQIERFQVVDSKVGGSALQNTKYGWQLSPQWTRKKLVDCLNAAKQAQAQHPTMEGNQRIRDYERMISMMDAGYVPQGRVNHYELRKNENGTINLIQQNYKAVFAEKNGKPTLTPSGKPMRIDMQKPDALLGKKMCKARNNWYSQLEEQLKKEGGTPSWVAKRMVNSLKNKIKANEVVTSRDVNKHLRDGMLKYRKARNFTVGTSVVVGIGLAQGGMSLLHDWAVGNYDDKSMARAGSTALKSSLAGAAIGATHKAATIGIARTIAKRQLEKSASKSVQGIIVRATVKGASNAAKKKLERQVTKKAASLIPKVGKALGAGVGGAFGAFETGFAVYQLQQGTISKQDAVVYGSIGGLNVAGAVAAYFFSGPVGWVVGGVALIGGGAYSIYREREQRKIATWEEISRARYNAQSRRQRIENRIGLLKSESLSEEELGWQAVSALNGQ